MVTSLCLLLPDSFFKTVCYPHLGCFSNGPPFFHPIHRPISLVPEPPEVIMPRFMLYTPKNRNRPDYLSVGDTTALEKSFFNPRSMTRILIHGYLDGVGLTRWTLVSIFLGTSQFFIINLTHIFRNLFTVKFWNI